MTEVLHTVKQMQRRINIWKDKGFSVGLVPTMGSIHAGHLSMIKRARKMCDRTIVSIFINSLQFGPNEDYKSYPKNFPSDKRILNKMGVHLLYQPSLSEIYPSDFQTIVSVSGITKCLCGLFRPGHFEGVATIITKLFLQILPNIAFFGEKDYQQLLVIQKLVKDFSFPIKIKSVPIVREQDGLAFSSRNSYLTKDQRLLAPNFYKTIYEISKQVNQGRRIANVLNGKKRYLLKLGFDKVDYLEVRSSANLKKLKVLKKPARVFGAVHLGKTRLIDNRPIR